MEIWINDKKLTAENGQMIIEVADSAGIYIPRFCYHPKLSIAANCRQCMVEVEGVAKPLPACATPVSANMRVQTSSDLATEAQQGTLEFLLINHPLDCPICDQGGECPLQDQSLEYGQDHSRFEEPKRAVADFDKGPLIATEMTRCIHCTRCVRFGQEIAGELEFAAFGRGEHTTIGTYLNHSVDSEISGNVIDICPVGALTSKPSRFKYRSWELSSYPAIAPHDCMGSNIQLQTLRKKIRRIVPRSNESINECWISNRDRYAWQGFSNEDRLSEPMIKVDGQWRQVSWQVALQTAAAGIRQLMEHGATHHEQASHPIGALVSPLASCEEGVLLAELLRALGSDHIDYRLREVDSESEETVAPPVLGRSIESLESLESVLLLGSNVRKEQPLFAVRMRRSPAHTHARIHVINAMDYAFNFSLGQRLISDPVQMYLHLQSLAVAVAECKNVAPPTGLGVETVSDAHRMIAKDLLEGAHKAAIFCGLSCIQHPHSYSMRGLAYWIASQCGCSVGILDSGNAAGLWSCGVRPKEQGYNAVKMIQKPLPGYLLFGVEPQHDCAYPKQALKAMRQAESVIAFSAYRSDVLESHSTVMLPLALYSEREGSHMNCEGRLQSTPAIVPAPGQAKSGWKIIRVLANMLELPGFSYMETADVCANIPAVPCSEVRAEPNLAQVKQSRDHETLGTLQCLYEVPPYRLDAVLRRAESLQLTADNPGPTLRLHPQEAAKRELKIGQSLEIILDQHQRSLPWCEDARVPLGCVYVPATYEQTTELDCAVGTLVELKQSSAAADGS